MYLGIDIGGTKTLLAVMDEHGVIVEKQKFPTNKDYSKFKRDLQQHLSEFKIKDFMAGGVGITAIRFDREKEIATNFSNLGWRGIHIQKDMEAITNCPLVIENDAKLAALSEAMLVKNEFSVVLYITISTGIGYGLVRNGQIDDNIGDGGGKTIILEHNGKYMPWEEFASGKAIVERFGKMAKDINDEKTWKIISRDLALGVTELIAITQPEVIVFGGSVGNYFDKYKDFLEADIAKYHIPLVDLPQLKMAGRPDDAVVYGCYDLATKVFHRG